MADGDTRSAILDAARASVQKCGFSELSFRDLAAEVGVKSSSIHYHFPTKADLGVELMRCYTEAARQDLAHIAKSRADTAGRLAAYFGLFREALADGNRMCLYGILSAEAEALAPPLRAELAAFEQANVAWLAEAIDAGLPAAERGSRARAIFAATIGAQVVARGRADVATYDAIVDTLRGLSIMPTAGQASE